MAFSSTLFVFLFLPAFLLVVWTVPRSLKNAVTLLASLLFYAWGAPTFLPVVLALAVLDYWLSQAISRARAEASAGRRGKLLLALGVTTHLSVLAYFKYSNFFVEQANTLLGAVGLRPLAWTQVILPIGVSFITFEEISYLCDVYRGDAPPARRFSHYLMFLMLFPHSIAGPIFRWKDLREQIAKREQTWENARVGFERFTVGLAKKVLIADLTAITVDGVFATPSGEMTSSLAWLGALAFSVQVYFDFSGYSDMAIGLGRMIGFRFKENFDHPYSAASLTEFWTRWHISLMTWLRDYLYIPLGGSQKGPTRTLINLGLVFVLAGFWHGAAWTFVIWGSLHAVFVTTERLTERQRRRLPVAFGHGLTLVAFVSTSAIFRAQSVQQAFSMMSAMMGFGAASSAEPLVGRLLPGHARLALAAGIALALWPIAVRYRARLRLPDFRTAGLAVSLGHVLLLGAAMVHIVSSRFTPLIYFRF